MNEEHTWTGNSEVDAAIVMLDRIDCSPEDDSRVDAVEATLRRLHARVQELEAEPESIGAGGLSAQRVTQAKDHIAQDRRMVAAPVVLPEPVARRYKDKITGLHHYGERPTFQEEYQNTEPLYTEQQVRALLATGGQAHVWEAPVRELLSHIDDILPDDAFGKIDTKTWGAVSRLVGIAANCLPQADALDAIAAAVAAEREACAKLCETFADRVFDIGFTPVEKEHPFSTIAGANQCAVDIRARAAIAAAKEK